MNNLDKMKQGIEAYRRVKGFTQREFAKRHSLDIVTFRSLHPRAKTNISILAQERMLNDILDNEGLILEDLDDYVKKAMELETMAKMIEIKDKSLIKSRDPERIKPFLEKLEALWSMHPDLRFGQIVSSLSAKIDGDSFYVEDDVWLDKIKEKINE